MFHRKQHNSRIKTQVAMEAMKIQQIIVQVASQYGRHPNRVSRRKKQVIEGVSRYVFLLLLMNFGAFSANAQRQQEQIVFVSEGEEVDQIQLSTGAGGQVKELTIQQQSFYSATPSLSFDGKRVAYVWQMAHGGQWHYDIHVMDIRSGEQHQVTFSQSADLHPSWAPDGSRIAFASDSEGVFNLYTIDANGRNRTRMTNSTGDDVQPDWSPDGRKIAFASDQASAVHQIYWMDVKTGHQQKLTQSDFDTNFPRWSPDGAQVAYVSEVVVATPRAGGRQIWQANTDGTGLKSLITDGKFNDHPAVSPDGKQIAFTSDRDDTWNIFTFDRITLQTRHLTRDLSFDSEPSWSPDGKHLVFVSKRAGNSDIFKMKADSGGIVNLTQSEAFERMPAWSPRGDLISFVRKVDGKSEIHVMNSDGNGQMRLDNSPFYNTSPTWSPQGDEIAFVNKPKQNAKVYRIYTINKDGQNKQLIFETEATSIRNINWSPNGKKIVFVYYSVPDRINEIRMLDVMTREVNSIDWMEVIAPDNPDWTPLSRTMVFSAIPVARRPSIRYGIFLMDANGNNQVPLRNTFTESPHGEGRFSWSPDGGSILFSRGTGNLYVTGLHGGGVRLFIRNAHSPDWQTPRVWRSVQPKNKLQTTWGEVKEINRAQN